MSVIYGTDVYDAVLKMHAAGFNLISSKNTPIILEKQFYLIRVKSTNTQS